MSIFNDPKTKCFSQLLTKILPKKEKFQSFLKFEIALEIIKKF